MEIKKATISRSSVESEYMAMTSTVCEIMQLYFLNDLQIQQDGKTTIYTDNNAAIHIATTLVFHERIEHIEIDCHLVTEHLKVGLFMLQHV